MIQTLKAESRKLLTVRSTYVIMGIGLLLSAFVNFWVYGFKNVSDAVNNAHVLNEALLGTVSTMGLFISIATALIIGHEYRYNTILYSILGVNRRIKLFAAKYVVLAVFAVGFAALAALVATGMFYLGRSVGGHVTIPQDIAVWSLVWRSIATVLGMMTFAFVISFILRNLIGTIVTILIVPSTVEGLLSLLLKDNVKYLPYTALGSLSSNSPQVNLTASLLTVTAYVVVGLAVAAWLFQKRDAN